MCCFHHVGYLAFDTEDGAVEAIKKPKNLKWLMVDDWYGARALILWGMTQ